VAKVNPFLTILIISQPSPGLIIHNISPDQAKFKTKSSQDRSRSSSRQVQIKFKTIVKIKSRQVQIKSSSRQVQIKPRQSRSSQVQDKSCQVQDQSRSVKSSLDQASPSQSNLNRIRQFQTQAYIQVPDILFTNYVSWDEKKRKTPQIKNIPQI
jgi:hypothetical protein